MKKVIILIVFLFFIPIFSIQASLININTANSEELQTLNGIGPVKAGAIIEFRNLNGPFINIEDIKKVSGIGEVTFNNIKDYITVGDHEDDPPYDENESGSDLDKESNNEEDNIQEELVEPNDEETETEETEEAENIENETEIHEDSEEFIEPSLSEEESSQEEIRRLEALSYASRAQFKMPVIAVQQVAETAPPARQEVSIATQTSVSNPAPNNSNSFVSREEMSSIDNSENIQNIATAYKSLDEKIFSFLKNIWSKIIFWKKAPKQTP